MIEKRLGIIGVSLLLVYFFVAQATDVATTQVINHFEDQQDQIAFAYPDGWEVVQDTGFAGENEIMLYSSDLGSIVISVLEEDATPRDWFAARRSEFHAELIAVVAEFELAGFPALVIGQPDTCETVAMLQAIISRENDLLHIAYYATWEEADIEAFQTILNSLSFAAETSSHSTVNEIPFITFPSVPETFVCDIQSIQNTTSNNIKARKCAGAPMYIPMEGALWLPWGCIDKLVCDPYHRNEGRIYFRQPHRGIDIGSGKQPGRTPVYAPYNATARHYHHPGDPPGTPAYSLRLQYDAPYNAVASYLTHMGNAAKTVSYIQVSYGEKVYGGITRLGYEGDAGVPGSPHLHISWHGWPGGEGDFSNTLDPTPYLLVQNLRFHANWASVAGPLTCTTTPIPPPAPPTTDFFNEELAASQLNADTIWWFPWYDSSLGRRDTIHVANPGPNSAIIDIYVAGQRRTTAASVAAGGAWHIRYDGVIGGPVKIVSTNGQPIVASKRTIWNEPQVSTLDFPTNVPAAEPFGIGDASTVWWSPWYDSTNDRRNWILVGNPGPNYAQVEIRIGGEKTPDSPYVIPAGKVWTPRYMDKIGGPVQVISLNQQPVFVSQRVLWPDTRSFNEVQGMPQHLADTEWWAPWYDASNGINNSIHVVNTANSAATIDIYVAGVKRTSGATIPAGGRWHARYDDVIGGPVRVVSTNGRRIIVSQRVLWTNHASFDETMAVPADQLDTTWWFPWYDSTGTRIAVIHLANPGPSSAQVEIYIDGQRTADTPVTIPAGTAWHTRYQGAIGGPVRIVSTNGQTILANQRVRWDGAGVFNEVKGVPQALLALPQGPAPLHINTLAVTTPDGNIISEVRQSQYVHFGLGAENWIGTWQDTYWDWTVRDSQGNIVSTMSKQDVPLYIPTGLIGRRIGVQVPTNLPPGEYVLTGSVVDANNSASATSSVSFRVNESMNLYLPLITR